MTGALVPHQLMASNHEEAMAALVCAFNTIIDARNLWVRLTLRMPLAGAAPMPHRRRG